MNTSIIEKIFSQARKLYSNSFFRIMLAFIATFLILASLSLIVEQNAPDHPNKVHSYWDALWYTVVTVSTTGYGDFFPKSSAGRVVAIITMAAGVTFVGMVSGRIASFLVEKALIERRGLMDLSRIEEHVVICGWKKNMEKVLNDILHLNEDIKPGNLVVIANVTLEAVDLFKQQNPDLSDAVILRGEHYNETMLQKASVGRARKILVLSDESEMISPTEADSRTVITAMTLNKLVKTVPICAELLDKKFEPYLRNAHVDEIIYSNEYSRALIANASASTGIAKVLNVLLDAQNPNILCTKDIPPDYVGKPFKELREHFATVQQSIVLGILENIGNFFDRKREALKEAQKTPDISKLVKNLAIVKEMENNRPFLNPPEDYVVPENAHVILIEKRKDKEVNARHHPVTTG